VTDFQTPARKSKFFATKSKPGATYSKSSATKSKFKTLGFLHGLFSLLSRFWLYGAAAA
jgi:hypothetical protein